MTIKEAKRIAREFDENTNLTEGYVFIFTEAMDYLISELHSPSDMLRLGGYYYEIKRFMV